MTTFNKEFKKILDKRDSPSADDPPNPGGKVENPNEKSIRYDVATKTADELV